jgi:hypothetical protein
MKKFLLSVALLVVIGISAKAQFNLGIKGGINFSKIDADNLNRSTVSGYQAGLFARVGSNFYVQPELYFSSCGGDFDSNNNGTAYSAHVKFNDLNVPLLLGYRFGPNKINFRLMAGPVYTYALSTDKTFSDNFTAAYQDFGRYKSSTFSIQAGAGVDIGSITADLRYQAGLENVNDNFNQKLNLWALSVGFKFF